MAKRRHEPPPEVTKATQEYREEMDILADFLADCCLIGLNTQRKMQTFTRHIVAGVKNKAQNP